MGEAVTKWAVSHIAEKCVSFLEGNLAINDVS